MVGKLLRLNSLSYKGKYDPRKLSYWLIAFATFVTGARLPVYTQVISSEAQPGRAVPGIGADSPIRFAYQSIPLRLGPPGFVKWERGKETRFKLANFI